MSGRKSGNRLRVPAKTSAELGSPSGSSGGTHVLAHDVIGHEPCARYGHVFVLLPLLGRMDGHYVLDAWVVTPGPQLLVDLSGVGHGFIAF